MPEHVKAELIEGVVYMASPVRYRGHGKPHNILGMLLANYAVETPGVECSDNSTTRLDLDNEPQPDLALFIDPEAGGSVKITNDDYIEGGPELIAEIASSSVSIDLHAKLKVYLRNGVREYLVWRVRDVAIDLFESVEGHFVPIDPDASILKSRVFPGLWIDRAALLEQRYSDALKTLREGIGSSQHVSFVAALEAKRKRD